MFREAAWATAMQTLMVIVHTESSSCIQKGYHGNRQDGIVVAKAGGWRPEAEDRRPESGGPASDAGMEGREAASRDRRPEAGILHCQARSALTVYSPTYPLSVSSGVWSSGSSPARSATV